MPNKMDHIVIGADSLSQGVAELENKLGVRVPRGGTHSAMSTHNCVMQSGNDTFLEIIAVDPDAPTDPGRTRLFTLDDPSTQVRLKQRPRALCWVVGTADLDGVMAASPVNLGEAVRLTRGDLSWRLTVPVDGSLPMDGLIPAFIQWSPGPHPSAAQQDLAVRLNKVQLSHPNPESLNEILRSLNVDHLADVSKGELGLSFALTAPKGSVVID